MAAGSTRDEAARAAGISRSMLEQRLRDQLKDLRVGRGRRERGRVYVDPTPEEIRLRAAMVRRTWTPDRWGIREPDPNDGDGRYAPP
jgi:hypothetical protein